MQRSPTGIQLRWCLLSLHLGLVQSLLCSYLSRIDFLTVLLNRALCSIFLRSSGILFHRVGPLVLKLLEAALDLRPSILSIHEKNFLWLYKPFRLNLNWEKFWFSMRTINLHGLSSKLIKLTKGWTYGNSFLYSEEGPRVQVGPQRVLARLGWPSGMGGTGQPDGLGTSIHQSCWPR